ncbi:MAG: N-acetylmuramic acid 6-phosphate etherase [Burkholderiales bacterium]|nr:N-acetylmuramic acid 6-phosphate etherase [Burkholderiales bacterium]
MLKTESPSLEHTRLDEYSIDDLVAAFADDQLVAVNAVRAARGQIAAAVAAAVPRLERGGRLIYVGAGTSGRLGLLDSVELYPTFSWPQERAIALLAGGNEAVYRAVEGAEDRTEQGGLDLQATNPGANDVVIALAAAGTTPYTLGALRAARAAGALTIGIANNPDAPLTGEAEFGITLDTGSELISGSTRLKAGTAQKITLNTFSSAVMVRLNKVYGNLMVDMKPTNAKLIRRAVRLTMLATGADESLAQTTLEGSQFRIKVAIIAIVKKVGIAEAEARLATAKGSVRQAMGVDDSASAV